MDNKIKTRCFPESNYKSIYHNGKTIRIPIDSRKPITELVYPEFLDVKITNTCEGKCDWCYMGSVENESHYENIVEKVQNYFGNMTENQKPFQIAYGGGEPTSHPDFCKLMKATYDLGITPNYTTNGMFAYDIDKAVDILETTKKYCGGVAISCHPHLQKYWKYATAHYLNNEIDVVNFHIIISDKKSVDYFAEIYKEYKGKIKYFVLLPYIVKGRAEQKEIDIDYLFDKLKEYSNIDDIAFGAKFYPYLKEDNFCKCSLYEPEIMSKFLDLKDMKIYGSSFE